MMKSGEGGECGSGEADPLELIALYCTSSHGSRGQKSKQQTSLSEGFKAGREAEERADMVCDWLYDGSKRGLGCVQRR